MKKCRVVGPQDVDGVETGGIVELEDHDADRLIAGGHVVLVATRSSKSNSTDKEAD